MKQFRFIIINILALLFIYQFFNSPALATQFGLTAPTGNLTRGENVQFTITIDTEGQTLTSTQIGMTYDTTALQFISATPSGTFTTVNTDTSQTGKLIFTANNDAGYSGSGNLAVVTFTIIAQSSGSTNLCVLYNPTTPTSAPPSTPGPTSLPRTGSADMTAKGATIGFAFFLAAGAMITIRKKTDKPTLH